MIDKMIYIMMMHAAAISYLLTDILDASYHRKPAPLLIISKCLHICRRLGINVTKMYNLEMIMCDALRVKFSDSMFKFKLQYHMK